MLFHEEEENTIAFLEDYEDSTPVQKLVMTFEQGDKYLCHYLEMFESDNGGDLDIEPEDPRWDDFWMMVYEVDEILKPGPNFEPVGNCLLLTYAHFPTLITTEAGEQIYPPSPSAHVSE